MQIQSEGNVFSYNNDQFRKTLFLTKAGYKVDWKRNGSRGAVKSTVIGFSDKKPDCVLVLVGDKKRWIKKYSVLRVFPIEPQNS